MGKAAKGVTSGVKTIAKKPTSLSSWTSAVKGIGGGLTEDVFGEKGGEFFQARDPIAEDIFKTQKEALAGQRESLQKYKDRMSEDFAGNIAKDIRSDVSMSMAALGGTARDVSRNIGETMARRGLGSSSVGLGAQKSAFEDAARKANLLRASIPGLINREIEDEKNRRLAAFANQSSGIIQSLGNVPVQMRDVRMPLEGRQGLLPSILGIAGGAIGGKLGGSQGAGVGAGLGTSLGSAFSRR